MLTIGAHLPKPIGPEQIHFWGQFAAAYAPVIGQIQSANEDTMRDILFTLDRNSKKSLQAQIREFMVSVILEGHFGAGEKMPSTRRLSKQLGISRNTVVMVYQSLNDDGYILASERSGYFVAETKMAVPAIDFGSVQKNNGAKVNWSERILKSPALQRNIHKPTNWQEFPYPFVYGQPDPTLFPIADWRDCAFKVLGKKWFDSWSADSVDDDDDEMLVEQIRTHILPRRGILVGEDQILVTMGAQMALYLLASLLVDHSSSLVIEEPGYPDLRNIFGLRTQNITAVPIDALGLTVDERLAAADIVYTTPSHQFPTTVTMPLERRIALLKSAHDNDFLIIEDDYELETSYQGVPVPALKSLDSDGRVVYVGSFSKTLFPGLRLGFMVASKDLIREARALRRLMVRHPPSSNQRITAFFLSLGYYDVHLRRLHRAYRERWQAVVDALSREMSISAGAAGFGGTSCWVRGADDLDAEKLARLALKKGIIIEPGSVYFALPPQPRNYFRLGFSSIPAAKIPEGVKILASLIASSR